MVLKNNPATEHHHPEKRADFLIHMYDQMFNDINTHILVVWQSVGTIIGAFALFALVEKQVISLDVASALMVLVACWLIAHLYDASYWYNRNLVIIANIERVFLKQEDLRNVHYYFGAHRKTATMLTHLKIQYAFGAAVAILVLFYHYQTRHPLESIQRGAEPQRLLPWAALLVSIILLGFLRKKRVADYNEFLKNSPGLEIDTTGIEYGGGHPRHEPKPTGH